MVKKFLMRTFEVSGAAAALLLLIAAAHPKAEVAGQDILEQPYDCNAHLAWGKPTVPGTIQQVCKIGYTSFYDTDKKIPRLVVYREKAEDTLGCLPRIAKFHFERDMAADKRANPESYSHSGFDLGHMAPDQDMASSQVRLYGSYSTVNVAPQLGGLNRKGWEMIEELVRAWALERGEVVVFTGSIVADTAPTLGSEKISIPTAFYKIVVDPKTNENIAFILPQQDIAKMLAVSYQSTIAEAEKQSGITIPVPPGTDKTVKSAMWKGGDIGAWRKKHKEVCHTP